MKRKEAITNLNMISVAFVDPVTREQRKLINDTFKMAIQALSQEPCDDAISREWLMRKATERFYTTNYFNHISAMIEEAPSVNPQSCDDAISREAVIEWLENATYEDISYAVGTELSFLPPVTQKSGKWIVHPKGIYAHLVCSRCLSNAPYDCETNFCPNCGARMESEEEK